VVLIRLHHRPFHRTGSLVAVVTEQPSVEAWVTIAHYEELLAERDSLTARITELEGICDEADAREAALTAALEARRWNDSLLRDAIRELRDPNGLSREDIAGSLERDMKHV
jgi:ribulose 1,5-bisphosphate carboxylase large subunit-like protein